MDERDYIAMNKELKINSMKSKTAVEWLVSNIDWMLVRNSKHHYKMIIEQAKEIEQAQRKKDFTSGNECACMCHENIDDYFNQYIKSEI